MSIIPPTGPFRKAWNATRVLLQTRKYRKSMIIGCSAIVVAAGVIIGANQYVEAHKTPYYQVLLAGEPIGDISAKELVENLLTARSSELDQDKGKIRYKLDEEQVSYQLEEAYRKSIDDQATLSQLSAGLKTHAVGVKLIVDGKSVGVVRDQETADALLQRIKDKYAPQPAAAQKSGAAVQALSYDKSKTSTSGSTRQVSNVAFEEKVTTEEAKISPDAIGDPDKLYKQLVVGSTTKRLYTVKQGDCIGCIASEQKVATALIYKNNPWIEDDAIRIGDVLDLTEQEPVLNVRSEEQVTETETIDPPIEIRKSDELKAGKSKVVRQGTSGKRLVTYHLVKRNGDVLEEEQVSVQILTPALSTVILKGTKVTPSEGTGNLAWPVKNHKITSYMGKRWGRTHKGLDIVGNSSILAADNGVVESAGTGISGLGNSIVINHNNGFKTVYGHLSKINVKKGQVVAQGEAIGVMGNTGHSFGTHLHFEVFLNSALKNPIDYL